MTNESNTLLFCPICSRKYSDDMMRTVAARDEVVIAYITCSFCSSSSLAIYSTQNIQEGLATVGMLTDLKFEEVFEMINKGPVTADEVLEINQEIMSI